MKNELIVKWVVQLIGELCGESDDDKIGNSTNIYEELGMDSLMFMEIITRIESNYEITIPDELLAMESFSCVLNITDIIVMLLNEREEMING